jgi:hypothetical protein
MDALIDAPCSEQKIAQFRTHYFTKELAYVSTQQSGQLDTFLLNHFSVYWKVAWLLSTHACKFLRKVVGAKLRNFLFAIPLMLSSCKIMEWWLQADRIRRMMSGWGCRMHWLSGLMNKRSHDIEPMFREMSVDSHNTKKRDCTHKDGTIDPISNTFTRSLSKSTSHIP